MTERRAAAPGFRRRIAARVLGIVALGLVPAALSLFGVGVPTWASAAAFVAAGAVAGLVSRRELRRFRCPRCGRAVPEHLPTLEEPDAPIRFLCRTCDVTWDTGLRTPSSL
jgi:hypothetical protein